MVQVEKVADTLQPSCAIFGYDPRVVPAGLRASVIAMTMGTMWVLSPLRECGSSDVVRTIGEKAVCESTATILQLARDNIPGTCLVLGGLALGAFSIVSYAKGI